MNYFILLLFLFSGSIWTNPDSQDEFEEVALTQKTGAVSSPNALKEVDGEFVLLEGYIENYIKQLKGRLGCPIKRSLYRSAFSTRKEWIRRRKGQAQALKTTIQSENLTTKQKLVLIEPYLEKMKEEWVSKEKKQPLLGHMGFLCASQAEDETGHADESDWDQFARYFHTKSDKIIKGIKALVTNNPNSFTKLNCLVCNKKPAKVMFSNVDSCQHIASCIQCSKNLAACPVCSNNIPQKWVIKKRAKCVGCNLENVDTYCTGCLKMELCFSCSNLNTPKGHSCASYTCWIKGKKLKRFHQSER